MRARHVQSIAAVALATLTALPASATAGPPHGQPGHSEERRPLVTGVPIYPDKARDERRTGEVVVCFRVRRDGRVVRPLIRSSTDRIFNRAALRAARETRYAAAAPGAANATITDCMTFRFALEPERDDDAATFRGSDALTPRRPDAPTPRRPDALTP